MTTMHLPLSDWVVRVTADTTGRMRRLETMPINDGRVNADARALVTFAAPGWQRRGLLPAEGGGADVALALGNGLTGVLYIELDDSGRPLMVDPEAVSLLGRLEDAWPDPVLTAADRTLLRNTPPEVRTFLLDRLRVEGQPAADLFHLLPWEQVERTLADLTLSLDTGRHIETANLGYWFAVAIPGLAGRLGQLDVAVEEADRRLLRQAAAGLCRALVTGDLARIPPRLHDPLSGLLRRLEARDPLLGLSITSLEARMPLRGGPDTAAPLAELSTELPPAMHGRMPHQQTRSVTHRLTRGPLVVTATVTAGSMLWISADLPLNDGSPADADIGMLTESYGVVVLPIALITATGTMVRWLPLAKNRNTLGGGFSMAAPAVQFRVDVSSPPIGADELLTLSPETLSSMIGTDPDLRAIWRRAVAALPTDHPVRVVVEAGPPDVGGR
ncbi:hypothetical protein [Frankia tisae]|uniref:hypothetical protein n=1 Tax=Frankia tisae TaxID=2950104 RepID=UPI0021C0BD47|nr:hypothetical protein [Frankia tisae]